MKTYTYEVLDIKTGQKGCLELISDEIFGKYSKMKRLVLIFILEFWADYCFHSHYPYEQNEHF